MVSIKSFTDKELSGHIAVNQDLLESSEYGSTDYNSAASELTAAYNEQKSRSERGKREDNRVDIILKEIDHEYTLPSHIEKYIKRGIERALKQIDEQQTLLEDLRMEQQETM